MDNNDKTTLYLRVGVTIMLQFWAAKDVVDKINNAVRNQVNCMTDPCSGETSPWPPPLSQKLTGLQSTIFFLLRILVKH